jgi:catechol 2,3-dioxygenase-like lactoylglutathione lyase family enzyme
VSRLSLVTLGVEDLEEARRFYVDGLGWEPTLDLPGEVCFLQVAHGVLLALWSRESLAEDSGAPLTGGGSVALARNVDSDAEVLALLEQAEAAGGRVLQPARRTSYGGFAGYFADPDGIRWEVSHNPGLVVDADGTVRFIGA